MLRADEPISLLIEKLDTLARPDRVAILKRLTAQQRAQIERLRVRHRAAVSESHSAELIGRIAELGSNTSSMTPAACEALRRAVRATPPPPRQEDMRRSSLADAAGGLFRRRGGA